MNHNFLYLGKNIPTSFVFELFSGLSSSDIPYRLVAELPLLSLTV
jgi:hypothetical protein